MNVVRGDHHTLFSVVSKVVELACTHTDIQAIAGSDQVRGLAGGAHVEGVGVVIGHNKYPNRKCFLVGLKAMPVFLLYMVTEF